MKKILVVFGTRPEAVKMCPLVNVITHSNSFQCVVCVTGQHNEMLSEVLNSFKLTPKYNLAVMKPGQSLSDITVEILSKFGDVLDEERPDIVLVHGDTTTAFASALACFYKKIPVGHIEAGLRSFDLSSPFPEEFNRRVVDILSEYYFAPTEANRQILLKEGCPEERVFVTGNTGIDAFKFTLDSKFSHPLLDWAKDSRLVILTAHRRENLGEPMRAMFRAIARVLEEHNDVKIVYPVHLNPAINECFPKNFISHERIKVVGPMNILDFHNFLSQSYMILTDSGGIQEEAAFLGKPVIVMRDTTERHEGISANVLKLVGTKEESIYKAFSQLLKDKKVYKDMCCNTNLYGDGKASERIVKILMENLG